MTTVRAKRQTIADKSAPAGRALLRRVRRLWQDTRGVTLVNMAGWIGNRLDPSRLRKQLWLEETGRQPLTVGECERIIERILARRAVG